MEVSFLFSPSRRGRELKVKSHSQSPKAHAHLLESISMKGEQRSPSCAPTPACSLRPAIGEAAPPRFRSSSTTLLFRGWIRPKFISFSGPSPGKSRWAYQVWMYFDSVPSRPFILF